MPALLPFTAFALLFAMLCAKGKEWRVSVLIAATLWGLTVAVTTEALSAIHALALPALITVWLLVNAAAAWSLYQVKDGFGVYSLAVAGSRFRGADKTFVLAAGVIVALVGLTGLLYPPNTADAMSYHMPRIVHWLHNHTVGFYPTHELRQLNMQPWSEYAMLHFHALYGGDRLDNLVQCFSLAGCAIGVSLIAKLLGARLRGQILAALLSVTIPEGILAASAAQNDYVLSFWLVALTYYLLASRQDRSVVNLLGIGSALGLACLTKTTAFILAPPIILVLVLLWDWREKTLNLRYLFLAGAIALALNAGIFARNDQLFGSPLGPSAAAPPRNFKYTNDQFGVSVTASNVVRNIALHAATSDAVWNQKVEGAIYLLFRFLHIDGNDPRTTWDGASFHVPLEPRHEAGTGNPLHCLLIFTTLFLLLWRWRTPELRSASVLALGLVTAFILFCAVLRWQPWHTRVHLSSFVLWAAVSGTVLSRLWTRSATTTLGVLLLLAALPEVFENSIRPLFFFTGAPGTLNQPRQSLYFNDGMRLMEPYVAAAKFARAQQCRDIGFNVAMDGFDRGFEYPMLVLLGDEQGTRNVSDVDVRNPSKMYAAAAATRPCVVICPDCVADMPDWKSYAAQFASVRVFDEVAVLTTRPAIEEECAVAFKGWYSQERSGSDWWRWSSGTSELQVFVPKDQDIVLDGLLASFQPPNTIDILLNGTSEAQIANPSPGLGSLRGLSLHLPKGENVIQFTSRTPGIQPPTDTRILAFSLRNLRIEAGRACELLQ
jgi:hypothetical protein